MYEFPDHDVMTPWEQFRVMMEETPSDAEELFGLLSACHNLVMVGTERLTVALGTDAALAHHEPSRFNMEGHHDPVALSMVLGHTQARLTALGAELVNFLDAARDVLVCESCRAAEAEGNG